MALYRRYRPQRFQDVIGQDHVIRPIMAALRAEKTAHAYLFSGPRGCGKTTSARILARCLNCEQAPTDTPCGECESCRELSAQGSGSLDVIELDAASHGGVEDARELVERAAFAPARDRYKIFIIDEAHMVTNQGFNALLKLVEEPPEHVKFIFATTEPDKVISTIRSRTHHYPFRLVPPEILQEYLAQTASQEGIDLGAGVLPLVVRAGGGSVRDSLSVLDQLLGGATGGRVELSEAAALLGYTDVALIDEAAEALGARDGARLFAVAENVIRQGLDPRRFVEDLLQRLRDVIVVCLAGEGARSVLAVMPADQVERLFAQAEALGAARASRIGDLALEGLNQMVGATSPRLQLELLCARMLTVDESAPAASQSGDDVSAGSSVILGGAPRTSTPGGPSGAMPEELRARMRASMGLGAGSQSSAAPAPTPMTAPAPTQVPAPVPSAQPVAGDEPPRRSEAAPFTMSAPESGSERPMVQPEPAPELTAQPTQKAEPMAQPEQAAPATPAAEQEVRPSSQPVPATRQQRVPERPDGQPQQQRQSAQPEADQPAPANQGAAVVEQAVSRWAELIERADADPHMRVAFSMLKHCQVRVEGGALALVFEPNMAGLMQRFMSKGFAGAVAQFLSVQLGGELQVTAHVEGSASPKVEAAQGAASARPSSQVTAESAPGAVPSLDRLLDNLEAQVPPEEFPPSEPHMPEPHADSMAAPTHEPSAPVVESSRPTSSGSEAVAEVQAPELHVDTTPTPHVGTAPEPSFVFDALPEIPPFPGESAPDAPSFAPSAPAPSFQASALPAPTPEASALPAIPPAPPASSPTPAVPSPMPQAPSMPAALSQVPAPIPPAPEPPASEVFTPPQPAESMPHQPPAASKGDIFADEGVDLSDPSIDDSHEVGLNVVLETFGGVVIDEQVQQPQGAGQ